MTPDGWVQVKAIVQEALERPPNARAAFVAEACRDDSDLRGEVESLLAAHERAGTSLYAAISPSGAAKIVSELERSAHKLQRGDRLGPYEVVNALGAGGMGEVYKARDMRLHRTVAIKVLPSDFAADPGMRQRFEREAQTISKLSHPHICPVFDVGEQDGRSFLVMEYLQGESLADRLHQGPLAPDEALRCATQIAEALEEAHRHGIVHRDLKPANVILTRSGAKLLDFGIAKLRPGVLSEGTPTVTATAASLTGEGVIVGTPQYMAPEQLEGKPVDARTDIFAFGVVLYEMVTGRKAFEADSRAALIAAILTTDPRALSSVAGPTLQTLEGLIRRCLAKHPEQRLQSAQDLVAALNALSGATALPAAAPRRRAWRWVAAALGVVLTTVAVGMLVERRAPLKAGIPSIAVLPLENLSRDPGQEYFADGMTEALIADLAKVGGLRVISRTSMMRYKGTSKSLPEIARELKVSAVLEGSVQQIGDRVRITAQLIDAQTDEHLWAETYDRDLQDVLALQSEVARQTARAVRVTLTAEDQAQLAHTRVVDPDAYRLYLQARHLLNQREVPGMKQAIELLQRVIAKEPSYALAYAALSEGYSILDDFGGLQPEEAYPKAMEAARRALAIDPNLADAHASLGHILLHQRHWDDAKRQLGRAIELNPSLVVARRWYANALVWTGDIEGGLREARQAYELDPSSMMNAVGVGSRLLELRRYDEAIDVFRKVADMDPRSPQPYFMLAWTYALQNRHVDALAAARKHWELRPDRSAKIMLGYVHARAGRRAEARALLSELVASTPASGEPMPQNLAHLFVALGDTEKALSIIEEGFRRRPGDILGIDTSPDMDALRDDPRFRHVVEALRSEAQ